MAKKAIVIGGAGFIGSYVADELFARGYQVTIFDQLESPYLQDGQAMVVGDILDFEVLSAAIQGCDYVYHFAGVAGIAEAQTDPLKTINTNVVGTAHVLEACRIHQVKRFVFASTVYVYSDLAPFYRSSKQACELIIEDYNSIYDVPFTILRYGSLYGNRANNFNYLYSVIHQAIEEGRIVRGGNGNEVRDYIHVLDAARCSVDILDEDFANQYVMITGTQSTRVKDLLRMIQEIFKNEIEIVYTEERQQAHYEITPYSFRPKVARKLVSNYYHDLGQGILDVVYEVYSKISNDRNDLVPVSRLIDAPKTE